MKRWMIMVIIFVIFFRKNSGIILFWKKRLQPPVLVCFEEIWIEKERYLDTKIARWITATSGNTESMEVMTMESNGQGHGESDPAPIPRDTSKLPILLSGDEDPGGSPPPPSAATGFVGSRNETALELPQLVGMNTLNPQSEKEREEGERRRRIMSMNQKARVFLFEVQVLSC